MNASGVDKACKSNAPAMGSGKRVSNTLVTYLEVWDNIVKMMLIPNGLARVKIYRFEKGRCTISLLVR